MAPTNSGGLASERLRDLPTGGRTPLAAALRLAQSTLFSLSRRRGGRRSSLVVLVSDGRANVAADGGDAHAEALAAAGELRASGVAALVVDTEDGPLRFGLARRLCAALHGQYVRLADLRAGNGAQALADTVRSARAWA
jgi:magnesium chelatase subunit D